MTMQEIRDKDLLIYEAITGSRAYGTNSSTSDTDIIGVYVLPQSMILANRNENESYSDSFFTCIREFDKEGKRDAIYYELRHFLNLLRKGSPQAIESLFLPNSCIIYKSEVFDEILASKYKFINDTCKFSFFTYAMNILDKTINLSKITYDKELLDFIHILPTVLRERFTLNSFIKKINGRPELELKYMTLMKIPDIPNTYRLLYCWKYHYLQANVKDYKDLDIYPSISFNENGELNAIEYDEKTYPEWPLNNIENVYFDKKGYEAYVKSKNNAKRFVSSNGYEGKRLAHAFRSINVAIDLFSRGNITYPMKSIPLFNQILHNYVTLDHLQNIFIGLKVKFELVYNDSKHIYNSLSNLELNQLELTVRSRSELLRALNTEHIT